MDCERCGSAEGKFILSEQYDGVTVSEVHLCVDCLKYIILGDDVDNQTLSIFNEILEGSDE